MYLFLLYLINDSQTIHLWAQCCFVYSVTVDTATLLLHEFVFSFRPAKDQQVGGQYANV